MALFVSTGDIVVDYNTVDFYRERSSRIWRCRSLLGTVWYGMSL